ncbi:hypothetical protein [Rufibacter soli]
MEAETKPEIEVGAVYKVTVIHLNKARQIWVKVLQNDGCVYGQKCMVVGGETTKKLLHHGLIRCIRDERFKPENEIKGLRHTKFDF